MKYIIKYYMTSRYLHYEKELYKEFNTIKELSYFLFENISKITHYKIYRITDLTGK